MARNSRGGKGNRGGQGGRSPRASRPQTKRHYPRTARLNSLLQQIVADHLERIDDPRLGFLTVTGVEVDSDLNKAEVFVSSLGAAVSEAETSDQASDEAYLEALAEYRKPLQAEIATQARLRKTPEVVFAFDPGVRSGARIETILAGIDDAPVPEIDDEVYNGLDHEDDDTLTDDSAGSDVQDPSGE